MTSARSAAPAPPIAAKPAARPPTTTQTIATICAPLGGSRASCEGLGGGRNGF
jgi:hypothetical protein